MKLLSVVPFLVGAGIAISQVSAVPLRVIVATEHMKGMSGFIRVGHAGANNRVPNHHPNVATMHTMTNVHIRPNHGCAGSLRNKATQISNWFRVVFHLRPVTPNDNSNVPVKATGAQALSVPDRFKYFAPAHEPDHVARPHTFVQRLAHALMMLGPWEGRAIAFILGCGIGVLIRMFWVLAILAIRSIKGKRQREEFIEDEVLFEEDQYLLAPPQYVEEHIVIMEAKDEKEAPRDT